MKKRKEDSKITERTRIKGRPSSSPEKIHSKKEDSKIIVQEGKRIDRYTNNKKMTSVNSKADLVKQDV